MGELQKPNCDSKIKDYAFSVVVSALGDSALRHCRKKAPDAMAMIQLLDSHYASKRAASTVAVLTELFSKRWDSSRNMSKYVDEFNRSFALLDAMGKDAEIPDKLRTPIFLASFGTNSNLEPILAALRVKDKIPDWEEVTADLIFESSRLRKSNRNNGENNNKVKENSNRGSSSNGGANSQHSSKSHRANGVTKSESSKICDFCGRKGHQSSECYDNPESPSCRLTDQAKKSLRDTYYESKVKDKNKVNFGCRSVLERYKTKNVKVFDDLIGFDVGKSERRKTVASAVPPQAHEQDSNESGNYVGLNTRADRGNPPCLDSGASNTFFRNANEVVPGTYKQGHQGTVQIAAGADNPKCLGTGTIRIGKLDLPQSLHVEGLNGTLISVPHVCDQKKIVVFTSKEAIILDTTKLSVDKDLIVAKIPRDHKCNLYQFTPKSNNIPKISKTVDIKLLHRRLIHAHERTIRKSYAESINSKNSGKSVSGKMTPCHPCALGKAQRLPFSSKFTPATTPGEVVHSDLDGPLPRSTEGDKYMCTFVDQASRISQ